jgi:hypothetical protein
MRTVHPESFEHKCIERLIKYLGRFLTIIPAICGNEENVFYFTKQAGTFLEL